MEDFWNNKKILVTGHTGFKGSWLSIILKQKNATVYGLSDYSTVSDMYKKIDGSRFFTKEYKCDISSDSKKLAKVLKSNQFDIIFHFAAQALVSTAYKHPLKTLESNVIGTYNVINEIINSDCTNSLVIATTDKVYRDTSDYNKEDSPLGGNEFYSSSKVAAENIIEAFKNSKDLRNLSISTVRSGNVLGGGDGAHGRLLTDLITSVENKEPIVLRSPKSVRPWQDILDSLSGYLLIAENNYTQKKSNVFNLNSDLNSDYTVEDIANLFINEWKSEIEIEKNQQNNFFETYLLRLDSSKARSVLNWREKVEINEIIKKIVIWEKSKTLKEIESNTIAQIEQYF
jgi:CDP-glucose 4,6-dehydratase